jgi:hypothetical protein
VYCNLRIASRVESWDWHWDPSELGHLSLNQDSSKDEGTWNATRGHEGTECMGLVRNDIPFKPGVEFCSCTDNGQAHALGIGLSLSAIGNGNDNGNGNGNGNGNASADTT